MMRPCFLALALLLVSSCATQKTAKQSTGIQNAPNSMTTPTPVTVANDSTSVKENSKEVPSDFRDVDFQNFSYPTNWNKRPVHLKAGTYEHPEGAGGYTFDFVSVGFADVTDDGKPDAIVHLSQISCGVSCDGGSSLFYFYSIKRNKPSLVWRIETGSLAYECGLKSFVLSQRELILEVFRSCQTRGSSIQESYDPDEGEDYVSGGKFKAKSFTRFVFEFKNGRFIKRRRQILLNPDPDIRNYDPQVSIRD